MVKTDNSQYYYGITEVFAREDPIIGQRGTASPKPKGATTLRLYRWKKEFTAIGLY